MKRTRVPVTVSLPSNLVSPRILNVWPKPRPRTRVNFLGKCLQFMSEDGGKNSFTSYRDME
jgi:hypothetical protein